MHVFRNGVRLLVFGAVLTLATGCPMATESRTANQGGGSLLTAGAKVAGGNISNLTPDEIQIVMDKAIELKPSLAISPLSDTEAQAVVDFFQANNLNTLDDVVSLIQAAENDPSAVVIPASVEAVLAELLAE